MFSRFRWRNASVAFRTASSNTGKTSATRTSQHDRWTTQVPYATGTSMGPTEQERLRQRRRSSMEAKPHHPFTEGVHTFWTMRSQGFNSNFIQVVQTRHLVCAVTCILAMAVAMLLLSRVLRAGQQDGDHVRVNAQFGSYSGTVSVVEGVPVSAFLGVPYAARRTPRFAPPLPWHEEVEEFNATAHGPRCPQAAPDHHATNEVGMSEGCLHLNIWAPTCTIFSCSRNKTVVFFIHGGFFQEDGNSNPYYDGRLLAALGDLVVIVPNWRLGVLGFLNLGLPDAPINVGILDQAEALRWTFRNVASFGGNASDVVVVGHGSGASALGYHLLAGMNTAVRKVVFMSESPLTRYPVYDQEPDQKRAVLARLVCQEAWDKGSWLTCLRSAPVNSLLQRPASALQRVPRFFPTLPVQWAPEAWEQLQVSGVTALMGLADDEGPALLEFLGHNFNLQRLNPFNATQKILSLLGFSRVDADLILQEYNRSVEHEYWAEALLSDLLVVCPVRYFAEQLWAWGNRVHSYVLYNSDAQADTGISRGYAIALLFGYPITQKMAPALQNLSRQAIALWTNFFKTGEIDANNSTATGGTLALKMTPATDRPPYWVPNLRRDACEKLRRHFTAITGLADPMRV